MNAKGNVGTRAAAAMAAAAVTAAIFAVSCGKQQLQTTYDSQDKKIDSFIQSQISSSNALRVNVNDGCSRLVISEGTGEDSLSTSGTVSFFYAAYIFTGSLVQSNMFATNHEETASQNGWDTLSDSDFSAVTLNLANGDGIVDGLRKGLFGVKEGQECYIIFSGKHGFGSKPIGTIPANSALLYHVWVESIDNGQ